jgi:hypothetical protein
LTISALVPTQSQLDALRSRLRSSPPVAARYVRPLLSRTGQYVASPAQFAAYLGNLLVREQWDHFPVDTVKWTMAMFDVRTMSGAPAVRTVEQIAEAIDDYIEDRITPEDAITLRLALNSVMSVLEPIFGKQLRITGWLPGFRVAEGRELLELTGDACPSCTVNPTGYKADDKSNIARCLNSEDCGWTNA